MEVPIFVHSTAKEYFLLRKANWTLSLPTPSYILYNILLKIKESRLKDDRYLATEYVHPNDVYYNDIDIYF